MPGKRRTRRGNRDHDQIDRGLWKLIFGLQLCERGGVVLSGVPYREMISHHRLWPPSQAVTCDP